MVCRGDQGPGSLAVIMPVWNGMPYLPAAIESILAQDLEKFVVCVVDDGSRDGTRSYLKSIHDTRLRLSFRKHSGVAASLNHGLDMASAHEYCARHDADDLSDPHRLRLQRDELERSEATVISTMAALIDANGRLIEWPHGKSLWGEFPETELEIRTRLTSSNPICHGSVMYETAEIVKAGGYSVPNLNTEGYDLWVRLALAGHTFRGLARSLYRYRQHPGQWSNVAIQERRELMSAIRKRASGIIS